MSEDRFGVGAFAVAATATSPDPARRAAAEQDAAARLDSLAKPLGSLGRVEALAVQLSGIAGTCPPPVPAPAMVGVFAADHGVHSAGVSAWPQEVTAAMVATVVAGRATVNALAAGVGARVLLVDVGVAAPLPDLASQSARRVRPGTRNLADEPAMSRAETLAALDVGAAVAGEAVDEGARCLVTGELGIANTTPSAALIAGLTVRDASEVVGRGAGADDLTLRRKEQAIESALSRHGPDDDPLDLLASLGGLEIAALVGFVVGGAARGVPVVVDGVIADAALLAAERLVPGVAASCVPGHRSAEPAATIALQALGIEPVLDLGLRLGEGTGAVLALPLLEAAARVLTDVATIEEVAAG